MAPKKKKKPAANPARGFATVSQASKKVVEREAEADAPSEVRVNTGQGVSSVPKQTSTQDGDVTVTASTVEGNTHLSPEEFETALEESELQLWVDKHGQSVRREISRQLGRLQTDRRVLREQAQVLITRNWLPPELMTDVLDMIKSDSEEGSLLPDSESKLGGKSISEEGLTIRLWTLKQILLDLAFEPADIERVLQYVLASKPQATKEAVWGLVESLDWLALYADRKDLPDYQIRQQRVVGKFGDAANASDRRSRRYRNSERHPQQFRDVNPEHAE